MDAQNFIVEACLTQFSILTIKVMITRKLQHGELSAFVVFSLIVMHFTLCYFYHPFHTFAHDLGEEGLSFTF